MIHHGKCLWWVHQSVFLVRMDVMKIHHWLGSLQCQSQLLAQFSCVFAHYMKFIWLMSEHKQRYWQLHLTGIGNSALITLLIEVCDHCNFYHAILPLWIATSSVKVFFQIFSVTKGWSLRWICLEQNFIKGSARLDIWNQPAEYMYLWAKLYASTFTYTSSRYIYT